MNELVVVGGGVMGAGIAWRCAARGMSVVLVDRKRAGGEASWAAGGMLAAHAEADFYEDELLALGEASRRRWPGFVAELEAACGSSVGYDTTGSFIVAVDRDQGEAIARLHAYQAGKGLPVERWSGDQCREAEPLLSPRIHSGVWSPADHQVDPVLLTEGLRAAALRCGASVREAEVREVRVEGGTVRGVTLDDGETLDAARVVVAAGAWSRQLEGLGAATPPVRPVKGQMLAVGVDPALRLRHVVRYPGGYVVPKQDRWIVGGTMEERGFDRRVTAGGVHGMLERAWEAVPAILELELLDTWCGFRPASRDNGPVMGAAEVGGLFFCTGHYRHGIQLTPVSVDGVAAAILGDPVPPELEPFGVRRFARA